MVLSIDNLAQKYSLLPSEVLARATTFDLYVLDIGTRWSNRQHTIAQGKIPQKAVPKLTQEQMMAMIKRVKDKERKNATS